MSKYSTLCLQKWIVTASWCEYSWGAHILAKTELAAKAAFLLLYPNADRYTLKAIEADDRYPWSKWKGTKEHWYSGGYY